MMNIKLATDNRKEAAARLAEITGTESHYTKVPRCAYEVGPYTLEKDGSITVAEDADLAPLKTLVQEGLVEPFEAPATEPETEAAEAEHISLTVEVPMTHHTGATLRNLINLIYTRAGLLNKALGTGFRVDEELIEALKDDAITRTTESLLQAIGGFEAERGKAIDGLTFTPDSGQGGERGEREIRPPDLAHPPRDERCGIQRGPQDPDGQPHRPLRLPHACRGSQVESPSG